MELDVPEFVGSTVAVGVALLAVPYLGLALLTLPVVPAVLTGDVGAVTVFLVSTALFGTAAVSLASVQLLSFTLGSLFAFVLVGLSVSFVASPHSPVHWVAFGICVLGVLAGGWLAWRLKLGTQRRAESQSVA